MVILRLRFVFVHLSCLTNSCLLLAMPGTVFKQNGELVEFLYSEPLADVNEKGRVEYLFICITRQTEEILHVDVFLYCLDRVFIGQFRDMLDE